MIKTFEFGKVYKWPPPSDKYLILTETATSHPDSKLGNSFVWLINLRTRWVGPYVFTPGDLDDIIEVPDE